MLQTALPPLLAALLTLVAAWITTGSRRRRALGVSVGVASMLPVWLLPEGHAALRGICTIVAFTGTMRVVDLHRGEWLRKDRLLHVLSVVDTRRLVRARPRLDVLALGQTLAWCGVAVAAAWPLGISLRPASPLGWIARWGSGVVVIYAVVAGLYRFLYFAYGAIGFVTPSLHVAPFVSRSVQEFWGERWARPISGWLADTFFFPLARVRRPLTGVLVAFSASAAFHAYAVWVSLGAVDGLAMAAWTFAYFVLQGAVMTIERVAGVRRWAPWAGHVWTVVWMLALSPIFVEPIVRVLGLPG